MLGMFLIVSNLCWIIFFIYHLTDKSASKLALEYWKVSEFKRGRRTGQAEVYQEIEMKQQEEDL